MKETKRNGFLSIAIFMLPIFITSFYKMIESSIGPVVLLYSVIGGILLGFIWIKALWHKWDGFVGFIVGIPIGIFGMVLLLNFFIWITSVMGEMDYELM